MAGSYKLEFNESAADLKQRLKTQQTASDKEGIQLLYLLKSEQVFTVESAAALLGCFDCALELFSGGVIFSRYLRHWY